MSGSSLPEKRARRHKQIFRLMWPGPYPGNERGSNDSPGSPALFSPLCAQRVKDESGGGLQWQAQRGLGQGTWTVRSGPACGGFVQDEAYLCPSPFTPSSSSLSPHLCARPSSSEQGGMTRNAASVQSFSSHGVGHSNINPTSTWPGLSPSASGAPLTH